MEADAWHPLALGGAFCIALAAATVQDPPAASSSMTRAEIEAFLLNARIVSEPPPGSSARLTWRVSLDDGLREHAASVETSTSQDPSQRDYRCNVAAYELDKLLELNFVSPSVERTVNGQSAALTWWVDDVLMAELDRRRQNVEPPDRASWDQQMHVVRVFDELSGNVYRNVSPDFYLSTAWDNLLITRQWRIRLIDHTRTFTTTRQLQYPETLTRCDRTVLAKLWGLNGDAFRRRLGKFLMPEQLDALEARRVLIVRRFDEEIARNGEPAVLYDLPPRQ